MKTSQTSVMITKRPTNKWDPENRATANDPRIATASGTLMTKKLRGILYQYGECVSVSNKLILELLNAYIKARADLKRAERKIEALEAQNANNSSCS